MSSKIVCLVHPACSSSPKCSKHIPKRRVTSPFCFTLSALSSLRSAIESGNERKEWTAEGHPEHHSQRRVRSASQVSSLSDEEAEEEMWVTKVCRSDGGMRRRISFAASPPEFKRAKSDFEAPMTLMEEEGAWVESE